MATKTNRRTFLGSLGLAGTGLWAAGTATAAAGRGAWANDKLNIAVVGLGRQGASNLATMLSENIVAICDADEDYAISKFQQAAGKRPEARHVVQNARRFDDFRVMLDQMHQQIDAVVISTPDHLHFHPAWAAMQLGKHVYLEKPMAHNVWEVRQLTKLARDKKLATQLGVQRHEYQGLRNGVELVRSGVLGPVREVYSWIDTDRGGVYPHTSPAEPPTSKLNWERWLGPTEAVPYRDGLAHYHFRFWWKYGTGEGGNWGCHVLDVPFWALDLKYPTRVTGSGPQPDAERTPTAFQSTLEFPATIQRPAVTLHWHQGEPEIFESVIRQHGLNRKQLKDVNSLFIGDKGMLLCGYGQDSPCLLLPEKDFTAKPTGTLFEPSPGFRQEWINACKGGPAATCDFEYSGPLTESVLLANVAFRLQGSFAWDADSLTADNPAASPLLRETYRRGWEV